MVSHRVRNRPKHTGLLDSLRSVRVPSYAVYLFDVDGTLVHSSADICGAIQQVLRPHRDGLPALDDAFLTTYIGRHLVDLFTDLFPHYTPEQIDAMIVEYRQIYPARGHAATVLYPAVRETLAQLPGRKSTATTKGTPTTRIVLEKFGLLPYFDHVQGTDGFPAKPAPDVIHHALAALGARPEDCLFVGDSAADMAAGRAAGVAIAAVTYGYGNIADLSRHQPDYVLDSLAQLLPASAAA